MIASQWAAAAKARGVAATSVASEWCSSFAACASLAYQRPSGRAKLKMATIAAIGGATALLMFAGLMLASAQVYAGRALKLSCQVGLAGIEKAVYPLGYLWKASHSPLEMYMLCLLIVNALMEIMVYPNSKRSRMMLASLPRKERNALRRPRRLTWLARMAIIAHLIGRQVQALDP